MLAAKPHARVPIVLFICNAKVHAQSGDTEQCAKPLLENHYRNAILAVPVKSAQSRNPLK
jgi:hypothetical protein